MFKSAFDVATRYVKSFENPSRTKQSFKAECDINNILRRHAVTGVIDHVNRFQGDYGSFSDVQDYHACMNQVLNANSMFSSLPARLRSRFANDPGVFLDFVANPENKEEMRTLGLLKPESSVSSAPNSEPEPSA